MFKFTVFLLLVTHYVILNIKLEQVLVFFQAYSLNYENNCLSLPLTNRIITTMKKVAISLLSAALVLSSCSSYTATGASVGGEFGHVVGSAIGGITGGWRGERAGGALGTVGGVLAGAAIGAAVEKSQMKKMEDMRERRAEEARRDQGINQRTGKEPVDDRIVFDEGPSAYPNEAGKRSISVNDLTRRPAIEVRNARIYDTNDDGVLSRGEQCTVVFEIMNNTPNPIYDICPIVEDATGNKHIKVSPNLRVESIAPHQGIRYTATILADKQLKDGVIVVRLGVVHGQKEITSQTQQYKIETRKKALK